MKKVFAAVLVAVLVVTIGLIAFAGPTFHIEKLTYTSDTGDLSVFAPGVGLNYLGNTPWGFGTDFTFSGLAFYSVASGCETCETGEWMLGSLGFWTFGPFYDFAVGGCDPGPCDTGTIRLGAGIGIPLALWVSNVNGLWVTSEGTGLVLSASYIFPKDFSIKTQAYWDGDNLGYSIGLHVDMFSLGDWIRGNEDKGQTLDDLLDN